MYKYLIHAHTYTHSKTQNYTSMFMFAALAALVIEKLSEQRKLHLQDSPGKLSRVRIYRERQHRNCWTGLVAYPERLYLSRKKQLKFFFGYGVYPRKDYGTPGYATDTAATH